MATSKHKGPRAADAGLRKVLEPYGTGLRSLRVVAFVALVAFGGLATHNAGVADRIAEGTSHQGTAVASSALATYLDQDLAAATTIATATSSSLTISLPKKQVVRYE